MALAASGVKMDVWVWDALRICECDCGSDRNDDIDDVFAVERWP